MNNNSLCLNICKNSVTFALHCYIALLPNGLTRLTVLSTNSIRDTYCIEFSHIKGFEINIQTSIKNTLILRKKLS